MQTAERGLQDSSVSAPVRPSGWSVLDTAALLTVISLLFMRGLIGLGPGFLAMGANLAIDAVWVYSVLRILIRIADRTAKLIVPVWVYVLALFTLLWVVLAGYSTEGYPELLQTFRMQLQYAFMGAFVAIFLVSAWQRRIITRAIEVGGAFVGLLGILQTVLGYRLPSMLLKPADADIFTYVDTELVRANGLLGNTIVYSATLVLVAAVSSGALCQRFSWISLICYLLVVGGVLASFSRASIVGVVVVSLVVFVLGRPGVTRSLVQFAASVTVALLGYAVLGPFGFFGGFRESFYVASLFGQGNESVSQSTDLHYRFIELAIESFSRSPFFGEGLGTQLVGSSYSQTHLVITDGAFWSLLAQGGIVLVGCFLVLYGVVLVGLLKSLDNTLGAVRAPIAVAIVSVVWLVLAASMINSAIFGKPVSIVLWIIIGLAYSSVFYDKGAELSLPTSVGNAELRKAGG